MDKIGLDDGKHAWTHRLRLQFHLKRLRSFQSQNELRFDSSIRKLCIASIGR